MTEKTKHNTPPKSYHNQHTGDQKMRGAGNLDLSQETKSLEDIMQEMNDIESKLNLKEKPNVKETLIRSHCQEITEDCQYLRTKLSTFSSSNRKVKHTDKSISIHREITSSIGDTAQKFFGIAPSEQRSDPSLLQEGLRELSKNLKKLRKFIINKLEELAVALGIRKETASKKVKKVVDRNIKKIALATDKAINSSFNILEGGKNYLRSLATGPRKASSKDKNTCGKNNNHKGRF